MGVRRLLLCFALIALSAVAPEPDGMWLGAPQGEVPQSIRGGTVIHTKALADLVHQGRAVLIDVVPAQRRPAGQPNTMPWLPPPHRAIAGSVWLPGIGWGEISASLDAFLYARLDELTGHDRNHPVVLYCHPNCWMSWNAAKRLILAGYTQVYWYPDGIEGWQSAALPTASVLPEGPDAR